MHTPGTMLAQLREFAKTTSMKGVPRFMKAKGVPMKTLWLVSVFALLAASLAISAQLIQQYLAKPKVIKLSNIDLLGDDYYKYSDLFSLPEVTVCNQNPLTVYNGYNGTSWQEYLALTSPLMVDNDEIVQGRYLSPRGYLEYIGPQAIANSTDIDEFIIDCEFGYAMDARRYSCKEILRVKEFPNVFYSQCYSILINFDEMTHMSSVTPTIMSLSLYVNEVSSPKLQAGTEARDTSGMAVVIHEPGELPVLDNALFASTGQLTSFQVKKSLYQRIHDSDDPCWESTQGDDANLDDNNNNTNNNISLESKNCIDNENDNVGNNNTQKFCGYNYSQTGCLMSKLQMVTLENCGCISSDFMVMPANLSQLHFCGAFNNNITHTEEETACVDSGIHDAITGVLKTCTMPCREVTHDVTVSSSDWPSPAIQLSFYDKYIHNNTFADYFQDYATVYENYTRTNDHNMAMAKLRQLSGIRTNFAKIEITVPEIHATLYTVTAQFSLADLIASIGGNLNLWSGISAIIIIEVLDLMIRILQALSGTGHNSNITNNAENVHI